MAGETARDTEIHFAAGVGLRSGRLQFRGRGGAGIRVAPDGRVVDWPGGTHSLVQPLRFAARLACDYAPPGSGRFGVLPPFLYGPFARGRHAQAGLAAVRRVHTRAKGPYK